MRRQQEQTNEEKLDEEQYYRQLTPYDVMRMQNCKSSRFVNKETYPNIRPPQSKCTLQQTKTWLADAVENIGCDRPFGTVQDDDILEAWKQIPHKHTLSCYGLGSDIHQPEAIVFNQVLVNCLDKVNRVDCKCRKPRKPINCKSKRPKPKGAYVLNRNWLQWTINQMPTVMRKSRAMNAQSARYCPDPEDAENPFEEDEPALPLQIALDMEKPLRRPKHGLRRRHMYCDRQCGIAENQCTDYEWRKYKQDPLPYEVAFDNEMAEMEYPKAPEPKNFDELYAELVSCFEKNTYEIPGCDVYRKCCRRPSERRAIQGCGEDKLFGPFGRLECNCPQRIMAKD